MTTNGAGADGLPAAVAVVRWVTLDRVSERREDLRCVVWGRLSRLKGRWEAK